MKRHFAAVALLAGLAVLWWGFFPAWPDDWDGVGFLASIARFDLATFSPHPPGYPVYVALLRFASAVAPRPIDAARLVGVEAGVTTYVALYAIDAGSAGRARGALAAAAVCATPLVFHAFSGVGSEGPALALAAVALSGILTPERSDRGRAWQVGLAVGLGLGVRLSWAPFYLPFLVLVPARSRFRAIGAATLAVLAWAVPLVSITGADRLVTLSRVHLVGHFAHWGGTAVTDSARLPFLLRDLFIDGLGGGGDPLGVAILVALASLLTAVAWVVYRARLVPGNVRLASSSLVLAAPYLIWVLVGQNLREQPRHVLPLVFLLVFALSRALVAPSAWRPVALAFAVFSMLSAGRAALDAVARKEVPPPGAALLAYVSAHEDPTETALFTGASGRFLDGTAWQGRTHAAGSRADALLALTRFDHWPRRLLFTSELTGLDDGSPPPAEIAVFCRPERLDRRLPCLHLYAVDSKPASGR